MTVFFTYVGTQSASVGISDGSVTFDEGLYNKGMYWVGFFENDGYTCWIQSALQLTI